MISAFNSLTLSPALAALCCGRGTSGDPRGAAAAGVRAARRLAGLRLSSTPRLEPRSLRRSAIARLRRVAGTRPGGLSLALAVAAGAVAGWLVGRPLNWLLGVFFRLFNAGLQSRDERLHADRGDGAAGQRAGARGLRRPDLPDLQGFMSTPKGFIPSQDMGYLLVNVQLPDSASLERTHRGDGPARDDRARDARGQAHPGDVGQVDAS